MDFIVGLMAVFNSVIEMIGASWAVKAEETNNVKLINPDELRSDDKEKEKQRLLKEAELEEERRWTELYRKKPLIHKRSDLIFKQKEPERRDPLAEWVFEHDDIVLSCLEAGKHVINNRNLSGVDKASLADFLFKQSSIESVQIISDGIEVVTR